MATFYEYFKENMEGLGLPAPESFFGNLSAAVATGRTLSGGTSIADVLSMARTNNIDRNWLGACLIQHPGVYKPELPGRQLYRNVRSIA